jgi:hypothetical protein
MYLIHIQAVGDDLDEEGNHIIEIKQPIIKGELPPMGYTPLKLVYFLFMNSILSIIRWKLF